jgi:hypothetical protein
MPREAVNGALCAIGYIGSLYWASREPNDVVSKREGTISSFPN